MLKIRLFRTGKKNQPFFKIVVTEKSKPTRAGRFVEQVGFYNPLTKEKKLIQERIKYWISVGAKPSETIHNMLVKENIIESKKIPVHKKSKKKQEAKEPEVKKEEKKEQVQEKPVEEKKEEIKQENLEQAKEQENPEKAKKEEKQEDKLEEPEKLEQADQTVPQETKQPEKTE